MRVGFGLPVSGAWATPQNVSGFAIRAEQAGYNSVWTFQRLMVPAGHADPLYQAPVYQSVLDPMAALAFAAAATSRIRLGVAVINAPYASPAYVAKQATTVDVLSGGRLDFGLGLGWMPEEFAVTGSSMQRRGTRVTEYVRVLRTLWGPQPCEFAGEFYTVPRGSMLPQPVQPGGPPILLGGIAPPALRRAGRIADGWVTSSRADLSRVEESIAIIREAADGAGRDQASLRIICRGVVRAGESADDGRGGRVLLSGGYVQIRDDVAWLESRGVTEVFFDLNWDPLIGSPDVDPGSATARAADLLDALSPAEA